MTNIIETFKNDEDGVEVFVSTGNMGFHVSIKDLDGDDFVGVVLGFKDKAVALKKAENIAKGLPG